MEAVKSKKGVTGSVCARAFNLSKINSVAVDRVWEVGVKRVNL